MKSLDLEGIPQIAQAPHAARNPESFRAIPPPLEPQLTPRPPIRPNRQHTDEMKGKVTQVTGDGLELGVREELEALVPRTAGRLARRGGLLVRPSLPATRQGRLRDPLRLRNIRWVSSMRTDSGRSIATSGGSPGAATEPDPPDQRRQNATAPTACRRVSAMRVLFLFSLKSKCRRNPSELENPYWRNPSRLGDNKYWGALCPLVWNVGYSPFYFISDRNVSKDHEVENYVSGNDRC